MPTQSYDTIVIGLGSAGTTAASTLCKAGKRVLALEAQNRIGGRVNTMQFGDGVVEVGAEWIHGTEHSRVYELAVANNITVLPQNLGFDVYRSDGSLADKAIVQDLINFGLEVIDDPPANPEPLGEYITRRLMAHIETKYPELLNNKDFIEEFLKFMDMIVDNYEGSTSWNDVTTHTVYEELGGDQHMSWHRYGYKTFFEILLNTYNNGPGYPNLDIKLNTEVTQIKWPQDPDQDVVVTCKDGTTYRARHVIVTVSLGVLKEKFQTLFSPQLPQEKVAAIKNLTIGVEAKIIFSFDYPWWDIEKSYFGFFWKAADRRTLAKADAWIGKTEGVSLPMGSNNTITMWFSGDYVKHIETLPEDEVRRKTMDLIRKFMGKNVTIPEPTGMIRTTWFSNPFTRGSYSYDAVQAVNYPNARVVLAEPLVDSSGNPRVLFAGEATDRTHFSTVHGASDSGLREANRLLPQAKL